MTPFQQQIDVRFKERGWPYWQPLNLGLKLCQEAGEVGKELSHLHGDQEPEKADKEKLADEIGDVLFSLACIANTHGLSLGYCEGKAIEKIDVRDRARWDKKGS